MKYFFLVLFLCVGALQAKTVKDIQFDGLVHLSKSVAKESLGFDIHDEISEKKIEQSIQRFYKYGYFTDISVTEKNGVLVYHFIEKPIISRIEVDGYGQGDEEEDNALLRLKKGSLYDTKKISRAKKLLVDEIAKEGNIDTIVEVETETLENGSKVVTFKVNKGEKIVIEKIAFKGMSAFEPEDFDELIANKERDFMGWFWGQNDGEMKLGELQYDPMRIRDLYMQHGYIDSKVDAPFVRVNFDQYIADMSYTLYEGEVYRVKNIILEQSTQVIEDEKIREVIQLEVNQAFNIKTFRDDSDRIKTIIKDLGYAFIQVAPDLRKDKEAHTVDVVYQIRPGKKVFIRDVLISGNTRTLDRVTRREIYLAPGDIYSATDLRDSENSLKRTGYFEETTIEEKRVNDHTMDLIVKVKETQTGNIQVGGGYGSFGGILLSASISDRNIFGSGINMGFSAETSERTTSFSTQVSNPRLNDSDFSGSASIFTNETDYDTYTVATNGISFGLGRRFTRFLSGAINYSYSESAYSDFSSDLNLSLYNPSQFESYEKSAITVSLSYDDTDDYYMPRSGIAAGTSVEFAGLGGTSTFIKNQNNFKAYKGVSDYVGFDLILRYKARASYIFYDETADTKDLPIAERLYMGGVGSVRGFESYSLSPRDYLNNEIGGQSMIANSFEASFPLLPKAKLRFTTFYDMGWLSGNGQTFGDATSKTSESIERSSYGGQIEWFSPMGPIQLIFAQAMNSKPGDETSVFEFTMGQRF